MIMNDRFRKAVLRAKRESSLLLWLQDRNENVSKSNCPLASQSPFEFVW